jgi:parvulin-like peptidyl-prolyl isomerase
MVKSALLTILLLIAFISFGQTKNELDKIETISQAKKYIKNHPTADVKLLTINSGVDTSEIFLPLYNKYTGFTFNIDNDSYKILKIDSILSYRVNYIYFDGNQLSAKQIDSLRKDIISQYKEGANFFDLVQQYNMDANISGDTQWFTEGMMVKEFEDAVKRHKKGDIFIVDTPDNNWYHVVLKTFDDTFIKSATILKMKSSN